MSKYLSEKQAWRICALAWDHPKEQHRRVYGIDLGTNIYSAFGNRGLCGTIAHLMCGDLISKQTYLSMSRAIDKLPKIIQLGAFKFTNNLEGARKRYNFCMEQFNAKRKKGKKNVSKKERAKHAE